MNKSPNHHQTTLVKSVFARGLAIHSGETVSIGLHPAPANHGVVFRRMDLPSLPVIPARYDFVSTTKLATKLSNNHVSVATVEHLLSALAGLSIDNILIDIDSEEMPVMDGSALVFTGLLNAAGIQTLDAKRSYYVITDTITAGGDDAWAQLSPGEGFSLELTVHYDHPMFSDGPQAMSIQLTKESYLEEIAPARTFGFQKDLNALHARKLALGGGIANAIVLTEAGVQNPEGLRFDNELVRHKILDALGDLYLLGGLIQGKFVGHCSGHRINNKLLRILQSAKNAYQLQTLA